MRIVEALCNYPLYIWGRNNRPREVKWYMSKLIRLKALPEYFLQVCAGNKNFECRIDDRDVQIEDFVKLQEWEPETGYTGRESRWLHISYVLRGKPEYGLMPGYCIFSWDN